VFFKFASRPYLFFIFYSSIIYGLISCIIFRYQISSSSSSPFLTTTTTPSSFSTFSSSSSSPSSSSTSSSQALLERSLNNFEKRTIELERILAEERRKADLKESSFTATKNLLLITEQRLSQLDSTKGRNSDLESAVVTLQGIQGDCRTTHHTVHACNICLLALLYSFDV
jgi:hypothetical protein